MNISIWNQDNGEQIAAGQMGDLAPQGATVSVVANNTLYVGTVAQVNVDYTFGPGGWIVDGALQLKDVTIKPIPQPAVE